MAGEHKALLDAAIAHDADGAVAWLEAHLDRTRAIIAGSAAGPSIRTSRQELS